MYFLIYNILLYIKLYVFFVYIRTYIYLYFSLFVFALQEHTRISTGVAVEPFFEIDLFSSLVLFSSSNYNTIFV
jgi:hypothetical protein